MGLCLKSLCTLLVNYGPGDSGGGGGVVEGVEGVSGYLEVMFYIFWLITGRWRQVVWGVLVRLGRGGGGGGGGRKRRGKEPCRGEKTGGGGGGEEALSRARMHHKVVGNFGSEADFRSLYYRR